MENIDNFPNLTGREKQVLNLIRKGFLYKQVALELGITTKTVEFHMSKILRKFNTSDRYELEINSFNLKIYGETREN